MSDPRFHTLRRIKPFPSAEGEGGDYHWVALCPGCGEHRVLAHSTRAVGRLCSACRTDRGLQECDVCDQGFTSDEWEDRHTPDLVVCHSFCCRKCALERKPTSAWDIWDDVEGLGDPPAAKEPDAE